MVMPAVNTNMMEALERTLLLRRVFHAPRFLVFRAWTDPEYVAQWWGPKDFTNLICELDARPGGGIRIDMRGPDAVVHPMRGIFNEIVEPERLVFTSGALDENGDLLFEVVTTVTFSERGGKTTLTLQARVVKSTARAGRRLDGMTEGWTQRLSRLEALVARICLQQ
jgi:uncharacterized protein YndB with AHSA1/START domain